MMKTSMTIAQNNLSSLFIPINKIKKEYDYDDTEN